MLLGHPVMIERVLVNLIGNASKFTKKGSVTVEYQLLQDAGARDTDTYTLQLIVSDTGPGIPKAKQADIFEAFTRLMPAYEGIYAGQGLGLSITKKLISAMGGTIQVCSREDAQQGTTFLCHIPVMLASNTDCAPVSCSLSSHSIRHLNEISEKNLQP